MVTVDRINEITRTINKSWENPQLLSENLLELAALNSKLGEEVAEAMDLERHAETQFKYEVDRAKLQFIKSGMSATQAESEAKVGLKEMLDEWLEVEKNKNLVKLKHEDTKQVIDAVRSRLSLIKGDTQ